MVQVDLPIRMGGPNFQGVGYTIEITLHANSLRLLAVSQVDLPLSYSSSVMVRADEQRMMLWRAMITVPPPPPVFPPIPGPPRH